MGEIIELFDRICFLRNISSENNEISNDKEDKKALCVVLNDDLFLPDGYISIYQYVLYNGYINELCEKPRYYNNIEIDSRWYTYIDHADYGHIKVLNKEVGKIKLVKYKDKRVVDAVYIDVNDSKITLKDHYDKFGNNVRRDIIDKNENLIISKWIISNRVLLSVNKISGQIIFYDQQELCFENEESFFEHIIELTKRNNKVVSVADVEV